MFADWIEQFATEKVTAGCGGGLYCPDGTIPRENAAVFLLKAEHGGSYVPPPCSGVFDDVPCPSTVRRLDRAARRRGHQRRLRQRQLLPRRQHHARPDGRIPGEDGGTGAWPR
jgi:hypothetical protein